MCQHINMSLMKQGHGLFQKGNEPMTLCMRIDYAPCLCGKTYVKVQGNHIWVLAEPVPDQKALDRMVENDISFQEHGL